MSEFGDFGAGLTFSLRDMASSVIVSIKNKGVDAYSSIRRSILGVDNATGNLKKKNNDLVSSFDSIKRAATFGILGLSIQSLVSDGLQAAATYQRFNNIISFSSQNAKDAATNIQYLQDNANKLGIDVEKSGQAFGLMMGAFRGTAIQGAELRKAYEGITTAAAGMGLTGEQTSGAVLALSQMMGKGTVQAEELKGQLAERIPGALGIAARALGVTQAALGDMMKKGELMAADFIPKFTKQLREEFAGAAEKAANSLQANMNRIQNAFFETKVAVGNFLAPALGFLVKLIGSVRSNFDVLEGPLSNTWGLIKRLASVAMQFVGVVFKMAGSLLGFQTEGAGVRSTMSGLADVLNVVNTILDFGVVTVSAVVDAFEMCNGVVKWAVVGFAALEAIMWAVNVAMTANPIGALIVGIAALVAGVIYAYQRFAVFRASLVFIKDAVVSMFPIVKAFGQLLVSAFTMNPAGIAASFNELKSQISKMDMGKLWDKTLKQAEIDVANNKKESGLDQPLGKKSESRSYADYFKADTGNKKLSTAGATDKDKDKKGKGSGSGKGLIINIDKLIGQITVHVDSTKNMGSIKDEVAKAIIDSLRDVETSYS